MDLTELKFGIEIETIKCTRQTVAEAIRAVRKLAGANSTSGCGIHIHVDGSAFDARSLANLAKTSYECERRAILFGCGLRPGWGILRAGAGQGQCRRGSVAGDGRMTRCVRRTGWGWCPVSSWLHSS